MFYQVRKMISRKNAALESVDRILFSLASITILTALSQFQVSAQYPGFGLCPRVFGMSTFNISEYEGKWYEIEKYFFVFEATSACVSVEYLDRHDGTFAVEIDQYEMLTRRRWNNPGVTKYMSRDGSADFMLDLLITQSPIPFRFKYPYIVIDTDYKTYTIKYHCEQVGLFNLQTMWILGRNRTFSHETRKKVHEVLRMHGLDGSRLRVSDQSSCPQ